MNWALAKILDNHFVISSMTGVGILLRWAVPKVLDNHFVASSMTGVLDIAEMGCI
ncbi:hypothetical protein [Vibrio comitans]